MERIVAGNVVIRMPLSESPSISEPSSAALALKHMTHIRIGQADDIENWQDYNMESGQYPSSGDRRLPTAR